METDRFELNLMMPELVRAKNCGVVFAGNGTFESTKNIFADYDCGRDGHVDR